MEPEDIEGNKDDLHRIRDNQQNYENSVPQRLSFLDDPFCALGEQVSIVRRNAQDGYEHHSDGHGEKQPCAPPVQCARRNKKKKSVKRYVEDNTSNDFGNRHRVFRK